MWAVRNKTPYLVEASWVQDRDANKIWLVVVKATFDLALNGSTRLAEQQVPVLRMGEHLEGPGKSSLIYEGDLMGVKPGTDVPLRGSAWAGAGKQASSVDVQLSVGGIRKRLRVFGDRVWWRNLLGTIAISVPQPFESMPIHYERAYGGWDCVSSTAAEHRVYAHNPVGTGFAVRSEHCIGVPLPNVEYPDQSISSWKDRPAPAGLNALECHWSPRRELAGTYDDAWRQHRFPLWAEDFDSRYHNCAPADQQVGGFLRGGETVELLNLSPVHRLIFTLPRVYPSFHTHFGRERVDHRAQLATVIVEPDVPRVIMSWQTSLTCNHRVDELDGTTVTEKRAL